MKWFLGLSLGVLLAGCATSRTEKVSACCRTLPPPPAAAGTQGSLYDLTAQWEDDGGRSLTLSELRGRPVVISMFYATCQGICVITRDDLRAIEAALPAALRAQAWFVLVSLDAQRDTAQALRAYRSREELPAERWRLLRGVADSTAQLAGRLGIGFGRDRSGRFVHSNQIVVLDQSGNIIHSQDGLHADLVAAGKILERAITGPAPESGRLPDLPLKPRPLTPIGIVTGVKQSPAPCETKD